MRPICWEHCGSMIEGLIKEALITLGMRVLDCKVKVTRMYLAKLQMVIFAT